MSKITEAREALRAEEARIREEAAARKKPLQDAVCAAVVEAYQNGVSISRIAREYGTTARKTIIQILKDAGVYQSPRGFGGSL